MKQRFLSILMALCLVLSLLPTAAFAEGDNPSEPEEQQQETGGSGGAATPIAESDVIIPGGTAGTYTVSEKDGVTTVTLTGNIALTQTWTISENDSVILDLAGHTLTADEHVVAIKNEGSLTIQDSKENGGKVSGLRGVDNYGILTLEGGTITTTDTTGAGGCVFMRGDNAAFYVKGGQIKPENSSLSAIGFRTENLSNITLSLEGGTIGNVSIKGSDYTLIIGKANGTANDVIVGDIDAATGPWVGTVSYRIKLNSGTVASLPNKADSQITYSGTLGTLIQSNDEKTLPGGYRFDPVDGGAYHLVFDYSANPVSIIRSDKTTNYSSMGQALRELKDSDTLRLNQPYQIASSADCIVVTVPNVTLDLNGHDVTVTNSIANSPVQVNANDGTFRLVNNSDKVATITPYTDANYTIHAVSAISSSKTNFVTVDVGENIDLVNDIELGSGARTTETAMSQDRTNLCKVQVGEENSDNYIYSFTDLDTIASLGSADDLVTVTLLGDATTGIEYTIADVPMVIDLDGHTVSAGAARNSVISIPDGHDSVDLTVQNGKIDGDGVSSAASVLSENCTLVLDGLKMTSSGDFGIAANGSASGEENSSTGLKLTVRNCSLKNSTNSQETVGIFFPAKDGTLTIEDSQITGYNVGVQAFTGTITIAGDKTEITGSGVNVPNGVEGNLKTSGPLFDGAAVSIIQRVNENGTNPYGDFNEVAIKGGTFTTTNTSGSSAHGALHVSKYDNTSTGGYKDGFDNTSGDDETKIVQVSGGSFDQAIDKSLLASEKTAYTVTFDANGGTCGQSIRTVISGDAIGTLPTPYRTGYTFNGWYNGSVLVTASNVVNGDMKLSASWTSQSTGSSSGSSSTTYSPTLDVSDGGTIKVSPRTPEAGDKVTITPDPDNGYEVGEVTVTDRSGDAVRVTANWDGTYTFTQPRGRVTIEVTFVRAGESVFFDDVPASFWAYDEIAWAYDNGYVNGTSATTFSPNSSITRQQVWMILARLSGGNPASMAAAREWAMVNDISDGTNPGNAVTRQQLVALLYRYAQLMSYDNGAREALTSFPDAGTVSGYAQEPMQWSVANGIVAGTSAGTLNPTGTATRAQFAVILYRFMA